MAASKALRVAVVQTRPRLGRTEENLRRALALAGRVRADVYVLPELAFSGYNFSSRGQVRALAHPVRDAVVLPAVHAFCRSRKAFLAYGFPESSGRKLLNSAALVGPRGLLGVYRKTHLFGREKLFFSAGDTGFRVWKLPFGTVGLMVCFDWYFPESARTLALLGAQLVLHPSNLVLPHCPAAMVTRCLENRVFAATANRVGTEPGGDRPLTYIGTSQVVSPRGEILSRMGRRGEGVKVVSVDLRAARDKKINRYNDLFSDRRTLMYRER